MQPDRDITALLPRLLADIKRPGDFYGTGEVPLPVARLAACTRCWSPRRSCADEAQRGIETTQVGDVGSQHAVATRPGAQDHRGVDDVLGTSHATELPGRSRPGIVKRLDMDGSGTEEACQACLSRPIAPYLSDRPGDRGNLDALLEGPKQNGDGLAIVPFEGDQGSRVQGQPAQDRRRPLGRATPSASSA